MLTFETTTKFVKDMKRIKKRGFDLSLMDAVDKGKLILTASRTSSHSDLF